MKIRYRILLLGVLSTLTLSCGTARAQLLITEVMSNGGLTDWFELTNFSATPVSVTGFRMDDSSASNSTAVNLNGITSIGANESVVYLESSAAGTDIPAFRTQWGANATPIQIGNYSGSGVGLSSGGDGVAVFTSTGTLINSVTFGAATTGTTFGYNTSTSTFGALSADGQFGAYTSAGAPTNIGSPGSVGFASVPEPGAYGLAAGLAALGGVWWRRARKSLK